MDDENQDKTENVEEAAAPVVSPQAPVAAPASLPVPGMLPDYPVRIHSRKRLQMEQQAGQQGAQHAGQNLEQYGGQQSGQQVGQQSGQQVGQHVDQQVGESALPQTLEQTAEQTFFQAPVATPHPDVLGQPDVFEVQPFLPPPVDKEQQYIEQQEAAMSQQYTPEAPAVKPCRHEYVRIFQRKLKDLNRRMVCTKAYLPTGFKMGDFGHLGENSFCFCAKCRVRLYPKRSQAEKAEARVQLAQGKALKLEQQSMLSVDLIEEVGAKALAELLMRVDDEEENEPEEEDDLSVPKVDIHVEELEQEVIGVEDIDVESLKANQEEDSCELLDQEEG